MALPFSFIDDGDAPQLPVVFLHAFPYHSEMWVQQREALRGRARFIAFDARGLGTRKEDTTAYMLEHTVDDLLGVKGVTPEVLSRIGPYLTCVGDGKININAAPKLVIESLFEQMDSALAQMILNQRKLKPFESPTQFRNLPGMTDNVYRAIKDRIVIRPKERFYRVTSQASMAERKCAIEALLQRNTQAGTVDIILYREM